MANPTKRPQYTILFPDIPSRVNLTNQPVGYYLLGGRRPSVSYTLHTNFVGWLPFVHHFNMGSPDACYAYIQKLHNMAMSNSSRGVVLSAGASSYGNTNFVFDNVRHGPGWPDPERDYSTAGFAVSNAITGVLASGVPGLKVTYLDGVETNSLALPPHITAAEGVAGYMCWGFHSQLNVFYPSQVQWQEENGWWIIETVESSNGQKFLDLNAATGLFLRWFASGAFGGAGYENTPVGAVSHVDEPGLGGINDPALYFGLWAQKRAFAICAWQSCRTPYFQAIGDPLLTR